MAKTKTQKVVIPQSILSEYDRLRQSRLDLQRQAKDIENRENAIEKELLPMLKAGATIEPGSYTAEIVPGPRRPPWKEHFERVAGPIAVEQVIQATIPPDCLRVKQCEKEHLPETMFVAFAERKSKKGK